MQSKKDKMQHNLKNVTRVSSKLNRKSKRKNFANDSNQDYKALHTSTKSSNNQNSLLYDYNSTHGNDSSCLNTVCDTLSNAMDIDYETQTYKILPEEAYISLNQSNKTTRNFSCSFLATETDCLEDCNMYNYNSEGLHHANTFSLEKDTSLFHIYLAEEENKHRIFSNLSAYEKNGLNEARRSIVIDWIIDVHLNYELSRKTLFLAIYLFDYYIAVKDIPISKVQLLAVTSIYVASKYEETDFPPLLDMLYITANSYNKEELLELERDLLSVVEFNLTIPLLSTFLEFLLDYLDFDCESSKRVNYLADMTLFSIKFNRYDSSTLALSIISLVLGDISPGSSDKMRNLLHKFPWKDVELCAQEIKDFEIYIQKSNLKSLKAKYGL